MTLVKENKFNLAFNLFLVIGMLIAVTFTTIFKLQGTEQNAFMLILAAFGSFMGVINIVMSANGNILTFVFGFIDVLIGTIIYLNNGIMGNFALHAFYFIPMQFVGFWQWHKRGATIKTSEGEARKVQARRLSLRQWAYVAAGVVVGSVLMYFILLFIDQSKLEGGRLASLDKSKVLLDAIVMTLNIAGQVLMSLAYMEQWFIWVLVNVSSISLWSVAFMADPASGNALVMLIKYIFYFINSLNGLRIWISLSKRQISSDFES